MLSTKGASQVLDLGRDPFLFSLIGFSCVRYLGFCIIFDTTFLRWIIPLNGNQLTDPKG